MHSGFSSSHFFFRFLQRRLSFALLLTEVSKREFIESENSLAGKASCFDSRLIWISLALFGRALSRCHPGSIVVIRVEDGATLFRVQVGGNVVEVVHLQC